MVNKLEIRLITEFHEVWVKVMIDKLQGTWKTELRKVPAKEESVFRVYTDAPSIIINIGNPHHHGKYFATIKYADSEHEDLYTEEELVYIKYNNEYIYRKGDNKNDKSGAEENVQKLYRGRIIER